MKIPYFKVKIGYNENEYIPIEGIEELEKALWAFSTENKVIFKNGPVRGKDIITITEDWHRAMGWNKTHFMKDEDWHDIRTRGVDTMFLGLIAGTKLKVEYLVKTNQEHLIGKGFVMPEIVNTSSQNPASNPVPKELAEGIKSLAEKMRIK